MQRRAAQAEFATDHCCQNRLRQAEATELLVRERVAKHGKGCRDAWRAFCHWKHDDDVSNDSVGNNSSDSADNNECADGLKSLAYEVTGQYLA